MISDAGSPTLFVHNQGKQLQEQQTNGYAHDRQSMTSDCEGKMHSKNSKEKVGLRDVRAFTFLVLWYIFSAFTLFLNKYILTTLMGDAMMLGVMQMTMTALCGYIQMYFPLGFHTDTTPSATPAPREGRPPNFWRNMVLVGSLRYSTVVLGLIALRYVAVSFTETVKSSAPLFTVFISQVLVGEYTGLYTFLSLIPIMLGLALCSAYELSFNFPGLISALATNFSECLQNVYSKLLISGEKYKYSPAEMQFYTSLGSVWVLVPSCWAMMDVDKVQQTSSLSMWALLLANGIFFHFQTISAYVLMDYISPVTHSVVNTVKRAFLIWISVLLFGNPVTLLSGLGTATVTVGVLLYTKAKQHDHHLLQVRQRYSQQVSAEEVVVHQM
ncbi:solute carrier family 35 member E2A-like [Babylonia areolata]|uniref:solute carrier family 35 member E2A-like n=1 Tax=Babylonia areolata TaxID=304850 RepID=UPI003FD5478F